MAPQSGLRRGACNRLAVCAGFAHLDGARLQLANAWAASSNIPEPEQLFPVLVSLLSAAPAQPEPQRAGAHPESPLEPSAVSVLVPVTAAWEASGAASGDPLRSMASQCLRKLRCSGTPAQVSAEAVTACRVYSATLRGRGTFRVAPSSTRGR